MQIITSPEKMREWSRQQLSAGLKIGFVPTMGFFHQGHLSLMRLAASLADQVVVSLFVNPLQFGRDEDLDQYPRDFDRDAALAKNENVAVLFVPEPQVMYPVPIKTTVSVAGLTAGFCGASRPGHFDGVCTVVNKLFNIVSPSLAVFGSKDYQQLAVIRQMVADLNLAVEIVAHPTVREKDGLAMSSRNTFLTAADRTSALSLYEAIMMAKKLVAAGNTEAETIVTELEMLINSHDNVDIEYLAIVNRFDLQKQQKINADSLLIMAIRVGETRLIDNSLIFEKAGDI